MHFADGSKSNFEIARQSGVRSRLNEAIFDETTRITRRMKAILISGSHNRHLFVHSAVAEIFDDILLIIMRREDENPQPPKGLVEKDRQNFIRHFNERSLAETRAFITKDSFEDNAMSALS